MITLSRLSLRMWVFSPVANYPKPYPPSLDVILNEPMCTLNTERGPVSEESVAMEDKIHPSIIPLPPIQQILRSRELLVNYACTNDA
jgi:hypothetical protein